MNSLVGVGACYLDTILSVDHYPQEDEKLRAFSIEKRRGGNVPNTLEVLQQLLFQNQNQFVPPVLVSVLPASSSTAAQQIASSLGRNVDLTHCIYRGSSTEAPSSYIVRSQTTDSRTIVNYSELAEMTIDEFARVADSVSGKAKTYHFEGRIPDVTAQCIKHLRQEQPKVRISVEVEKANRPGLEELARLADVVFYSKSWAQAKGYDSATACLEAQWALNKIASHMFCTWGEQGASAITSSYETPSEPTVLQCDAFTPKEARIKVIDTIGAGDTFIAGALFGLFFHEGFRTPMEILLFANELAGRKVHQAGFSGLAERMASWF